VVVEEETGVGLRETREAAAARRVVYLGNCVVAALQNFRVTESPAKT
jgi:hypothetical protein